MAREIALLLYGHRGAAAHLPENTVESFACALEAGANALETDVRLTADGHPVLHHDPTGERTCRQAEAVAASTLGEVERWDAGYGFVDGLGRRPYLGRGYRVPTLAEILETFPNVHINIDIKPTDPSVVAPTVDLIHQHGAEARVLLTSFHAPIAAAIRAYGYRGRSGLSAQQVYTLLTVPSFLLRFVPPAGDAVQLPLAYKGINLTRRWVIRRCHAMDFRVDYWTVNDPRVAELLFRRGADGVMTDDPAAIAPVFERYR